MKLTPISIENVKVSKAEGQQSFSVPGFPRLSLRVSYGGRKTWCFRTRGTTRIALGHWPSMGIAEAQAAYRLAIEAEGKGQAPRACGQACRGRSVRRRDADLAQARPSWKQERGRCGVQDAEPCAAEMEAPDEETNRRTQTAGSIRRDGEVGSLMTDQPSDLLLRIAEAIAVAHGRVVISDELAQVITKTSDRRRAGLPVTDEVAWIENELKLSPGYSEWSARQLLDRALHGRKKAFV
jgi:Arm DNA-binding domain